MQPKIEFSTWHGMKPSNHKPCQTQHFKHFWHGTGEVVWPLSVLFDCFFVATSGSAVEPSCRILCSMASRGGDPSRWLFFFQQIKQSNHVKHMMFQFCGMDWAAGEVSHPVHWLDHFILDCLLFLLPPVAALWNQTVEILAWPAGRWSDPFHWLDCFIFSTG